MSAYADSSLLVPLVVLEPSTPTAYAVLESLPHPLPLTALHALEIRNAIRRRVFTGSMTAAQATAALTALASMPGLLPVDVSSWPEVFSRAEGVSGELAASLGVRALDALHIGAALAMSCTVFLTFDARQASAARSVGLACPIVL